MKFFIVFACLLATIYADDVSVVRNDAEVNPTDFKYSLELSDGAKREQSGSLNGEEWIVTGQQEHVAPDGTPVSLKYIADANGFQVLEANPPLPTPPPIPEHILRAIAWIEAHPGKENQ